MAYALAWDENGTREYELGCRHGVLYQWSTTANKFTNGTVFQGLTNMTCSPGGAEETKTDADDMTYLSVRGIETFGGTIEAVGKPPREFNRNDGRMDVGGVIYGQQRRAPFGFSYSTRIGNDTQGVDVGETLHMIYNATVSPSERSDATMGETIELNTRSWEYTTTPMAATGILDPETGMELRASAYAFVESTNPKVTPQKFAALKTILYGDSEDPSVIPSLPTFTELYALFPDSAVLSGP